MPSLYEITVPVFARTLRNLDHILAKAAESGLDESELMAARLAPDMLPLPRQVQIACDSAKLAVTRLAQAEPRPMPDEEKSLVDLSAFEGREVAEIVLKLPNVELRHTGLSLVTEFALPNFFFHVTVAYALLRVKGVQVGKMDYLAGAQAPA